MSQEQGKNWWGRNWKWFVPLGCFGSIVLVTVFTIAIIFFVFSMMKSSDAYKEAVARAKADPLVQETIGTPIEEGLFISGNIKVNGQSGQAKLSVPIVGPSGKATILAVAAKSRGEWKFSTLLVRIAKTKQTINLLKKQTEPSKEIRERP